MKDTAKKTKRKQWSQSAAIETAESYQRYRSVYGVCTCWILLICAKQVQKHQKKRVNTIART